MGYHGVWIISLPFYHELKNWSYCIKLSYTTSLYTLQVHLPRPGPIIAPTGLFLASALPPCTAHKWKGRPPFKLWLPSASWCTPRWGGALRLTLFLLHRGTTTLHIPSVSPSYPLSITPPGGGTPPGLWPSPLSPPSSLCHKGSPTEPQNYISIPGSMILLPFFTSSSIPLHTASNISADSGIPPPNRCYCRQSSILGMEKPLAVVGSPHLSEMRPYFPRRNIVGSCVWDTFPLPTCIYSMHSGWCLVFLLGLVSRSASTWGGGWIVPSNHFYSVVWN